MTGPTFQRRSAVVLATRGSPLARWQADRVAGLLRALPGSPRIDIEVVRTTGDRRTDVSLAELGGQGVFVAEIQRALETGTADLAVHSAKDLPARSPEGLGLVCVPERADPRDAMVGAALADLPAGALVATGSPRRRAQLAWVRPDLRFTELRGNIGTRLARIRDRGVAGSVVGSGHPGGSAGVDAVVVAQAALDRLGLAGEAAETLSPSVMLPQVGQGALAVECRNDDEAMIALLGRIDNPAAHVAVRAERAFLAAVGGGCRAPVAAWATTTGGCDTRAQIHLAVLVAGGDGHIVLRHHVQGTDPEAVGSRAWAELLSRRGAAAVEDLAVAVTAGDGGMPPAPVGGPAGPAAVADGSGDRR